MSDIKQQLKKLVYDSKNVRDILDIINRPSAGRSFLKLCFVDEFNLEYAINCNKKYKRNDHYQPTQFHPHHSQHYKSSVQWQTDNEGDRNRKTEQLKQMFQQQNEQRQLLQLEHQKYQKQQEQTNRRFLLLEQQKQKRLEQEHRRGLLLEHQKQQQLEQKKRDFQTKIKKGFQLFAEKQESISFKRKRDYSESDGVTKDDIVDEKRQYSSSSIKKLNTSSFVFREDNTKRIVLTSIHIPIRKKKIYTNVAAVCDFLKINKEKYTNILQSSKLYNKWIIEDKGLGIITTNLPSSKKRRGGGQQSCSCCGQKGKTISTCGKSNTHNCSKCNTPKVSTFPNYDNGGPAEQSQSQSQSQSESEIDGSDDSDGNGDGEYVSNSLPNSDNAREYSTRDSKTNAIKKIKIDSVDLNKCDY